ncbi:AAA family ATPase [Arcobacter defluvii]|uniref:ATP-binding protein (AAA domain) n=1 Tax=Arcobacter defluvii TaxID=873191 RepID=A0AAE7BD28_9BACT|nr:AAA family ATPase [Arcobacter defluvii]QKF76293.1 ATP-binding protein (AAA domain) [Arcobacter defluvii]RXI30975.1 hypothetical protein CP964_10980 [Arcobacter defluvii]
MELVYLWVKNYKNIVEQGFNFSPRFRCEYDEDTKELKIIDKDETGEFYPKNFFGDNINVTAIVGENGSGKSSLLLGITNSKIIIRRDNQFYTNDFTSEIHKFTNINREKDYDIIYMDFDLIKINPITDFWDFSQQNIYDKNLYKRIENNFSGNVNFNIIKYKENFYNLIIKYNDSFLSELFFYNPIEIRLSDFIKTIPFQDSQSKYINDKIKSVQSKKYSKIKFLTFLYSKIKNNPELSKLKHFDDDISILEKEQDILNYSRFSNQEEIDNIYKLLQVLENKKIHKFSIEDFYKQIYNENREAFFKLTELGYLEVNLKDKTGREYFDLSQGERKLFAEFLMLFNSISKSDKSEIFLVLDEPDLTLHPQWQKNYIKELIKLLFNFPKKKFHIIITSHSPFLLSDLPKENIIFLEKGKQVYPFEDGKQTFGANIHTLLSHGFFMKDGLMGEFAKDKIKSIINYHEELLKKKLTKNENKKQRDEEKVIYEKEYKTKFRQIQSIIGDDYLKQVIKNHLVEIEKILYDEYLIDKEIKKLEDEIERLKRLRK